MGYLKDGEWVNEWYDTDSSDGAFERDTSRFRNWITADGAPGPSGEGGFKAEPGRYHLYVSYACPWAHRTLIFRQIKGLSDAIGVSVVHPDMLDDGWSFASDFPGATGDDLFGKKFLRDIYTRDKPDISGRVTVPVLWDKDQGRIVSNESAEIIRMLNSAFDGAGANDLDFYPEALRGEIDAVNDKIYDGFNNGVYRAGFATSQSAYSEAAEEVFATMAWMEDRLGAHRYLAGDRLTEADWRAVTTAFRFDLVYHTHFKCNRAWLREFPNLWAWARELYQYPGVAGTCHFDHIERHYYYSHDMINPNRIIPIGPEIDWDEPHGRG
ncbi:MAG: glutathione S-transferase family protein [Paracoccus sp. (in: a-proteobacteria)]|nr:glutathione S-transferase family protein [Paracoccus sp. (in: a-proteobacteria)]